MDTVMMAVELRREPVMKCTLFYVKATYQAGDHTANRARRQYAEHSTRWLEVSSSSQHDVCSYPTLGTSRLRKVCDYHSRRSLSKFIECPDRVLLTYTEGQRYWYNCLVLHGRDAPEPQPTSATDW